MILHGCTRVCRHLHMSSGEGSNTGKGERKRVDRFNYNGDRYTVGGSKRTC